MEGFIHNTQWIVLRGLPLNDIPLGDPGDWTHLLAIYLNDGQVMLHYPNSAATMGMYDQKPLPQLVTANCGGRVEKWNMQ